MIYRVVISFAIALKIKNNGRFFVDMLWHKPLGRYYYEVIFQKKNHSFILKTVKCVFGKNIDLFEKKNTRG